MDKLRLSQIIAGSSESLDHDISMQQMMFDKQNSLDFRSQLIRNNSPEEEVKLQIFKEVKIFRSPVKKSPVQFSILSSKDQSLGSLRESQEEHSEAIDDQA